MYVLKSPMSLEALPVVGRAIAAEWHIDTSTVTLTPPAGAKMCHIRAYVGDCWVIEESDGTETLPGTWPPAATDTDVDPWEYINSSRDFPVDGTPMRMVVSASAKIHVIWF